MIASCVREGDGPEGGLSGAAGLLAGGDGGEGGEGVSSPTTVI